MTSPPVTWNWQTSMPNCTCTLTSRGSTCDRYHPYAPTQEQYREAYAAAWLRAWGSKA